MATEVTYGVGFTRNMGDFESLRVDISVTDSPRGEEKVKETLNRVKDFVEGQLLDEVAKVEGDIRAVRAQVRETGEYKRKVKSAAAKQEEEEAGK